MKVLITGASSGIGEALAIEYAKRFAHNQSVVIGLVARREAPLLSLQATLQNQYHVNAVIYVADVRDQITLNEAASHYITAYGAPNVVIGCAGVSCGTLTEHAEDTQAFQQVMDINVVGLVNTFQPFVKAMRDAALNGANAQFVGIASVAGVRGLPGAGAYSASKAAAISYLESLRVEMAKLKITVTTIAPGYIRTPMTDINTYPMPFLMDVDVAAKKFVDAITLKRRFVIIPWQMGWVARLMKLLPAFVWDKLAMDAPHKKR
jgi:short-subunit dehydrogenase